MVGTAKTKKSFSQRKNKFNQNLKYLQQRAQLFPLQRYPSSCPRSTYNVFSTAELVLKQQVKVTVPTMEQV